MQIDLMMATSSEAEATMNAARQIINNIENLTILLRICCHMAAVHRRSERSTSTSNIIILTDIPLKFLDGLPCEDIPHLLLILRIILIPLRMGQTLNEFKYRHSLAIGMHSNGSLLNANNNNVVERSVLERLASNPGGNDSDNAEKLERGTRAEPSTNVTTSRILQQLEQLIRSDDWVNKEVKDYGESPHPSEFPKK
ncbi:hypothetical protein WUBG_09443, partial [Wuchereria bancrofti]